MDKFIRWLNGEMNRRGWSQRELGRRAGMSGANVSLVLSGQQAVTYDFIAAVARALGERPEPLFRLAGLLPAYHGTEDEQAIQELEEVWRELTPAERRQVYQYAMWRLREQKQPQTAGEPPTV